MNQSLRSLVVTANTSIDEIRKTFMDSQTDLLLVDENSVVAEPHLDLLTDYPRSASAALATIQKNGDTLMRQNRIASATSLSHKVTFGNRQFLGLLRLSQKQRQPIIDALANAASRNLPGNAIDLVLVALVRATIQVDCADVWGAPSVRSSDAAVRQRVADEIKQVNIGRLRLSMANRANDGFFSVFFLRKFSKLFTWVAVNIGATPNTNPAKVENRPSSQLA